MYCRVSDRFRYCVAGARIILLDVEKSRYLGLPRERERALFRLMDRGGCWEQDDQGLQDLVADGILEQAVHPCDLPPRPSLEPQTSDCLDTHPRPLALAIFLLALSWELWTAAKLRFLPFSNVIGRLCVIRPPSPEGEEQLMRVAAAFEQTQYILGRTDRCLVRSLAMFSLCRSMGIATRLVIGVRSDPFAAHCWVQREGRVLNDVAEHARTFTPIWVVG